MRMQTDSDRNSFDRPTTKISAYKSRLNNGRDKNTDNPTAGVRGNSPTTTTRPPFQDKPTAGVRGNSSTATQRRYKNKTRRRLIDHKGYATSLDRQTPFKKAKITGRDTPMYLSKSNKRRKRMTPSKSSAKLGSITGGATPGSGPGTGPIRFTPPPKTVSASKGRRAGLTRSKTNRRNPRVAGTYDPEMLRRGSRLRIKG